MDYLLEKDQLNLEKTYVKSTYDNIAEEFSGTRYKKWPKVEAFVEGLPKASLMLDVGCGNGKYLDNRSTVNIGCDVSLNLLSICKRRRFEVVLCDMMRQPFRERIFDSIICVAALHHIVTAQRRRECINGMINLMYGHASKLLIQVWSYEQQLDKDNPYLRGDKTKSQVYDKLETGYREICFDEGRIKLPVHKNRTPFIDQDLLIPFNVKQNPQDAKSGADGCEMLPNQYFRYYHVFKENELNHLIEQIQNVEILESYYDRGNWCSIVSRLPENAKFRFRSIDDIGARN